MTDDTAPRGRPGWVWIIFILYLFSFVWGTILKVRILVGAYPMAPSVQQYFKGFTWVDWLLQFVLPTVQLGAATLLWLLRRRAAEAFLVVSVLSAANTARHIVTRGLLEFGIQHGTVGVVVTIFSLSLNFLFSSAVCAYAYTLRARRVLQ